MRYFRFTAKNLGHERYLTYIMGEGMEVDEDVLDYCEENNLSEIVEIIYEEDDDFDYLTYDITGKMTIDNFSQGVMKRETVLKLLRNVALGMISIKEHAIPLSYILLNKEFMYIDPDSMDVQFLYLPVESDASLSTEFKSFVRQLVAGFTYDVEEDLSYVGQLLTYINGNNFNLRGLIGLSEALMEDAGIGFTAEEGISTDDGTEVVSDAGLEEIAEEQSTMDFMKDLGEADEKLPEIGDDDDSDIEEIKDVEEAPLEEMPLKEEPAESIEDIKVKIQELVGADDSKAEPGNVGMQKPVKVSRAAMLKAAAEELAEEDKKAAEENAEAEAEGAEDSDAKNKGKNKKADSDKSAEEDKDAKEVAPKGKTEIVDNTILGRGGAIKINPYLTRVNTDEKIVINKPVFKIGKASRGVDYHISGNGAVSRQHAIILHKGESYYIKDNKSTNHTYVNNKQVEGDEEVLLNNNCTITLGDEDFVFKLS
ncbi:FHA domain-containing protein [Lachnospiraceae bacterium]|nr:FHA domain-containing protein [Lachnospiraceae bacterium]